MPETRHVEVYEQGTGRLLEREPYEVSDEQLRLEQLERRKNEILRKPKLEWLLEDLKDLLEYLITKEER